MFRSKHSYYALFIAGALLAGGCSSDNRADESKQAIQSISDVNKELAKGQTQVNQTVALLGQLQQDGGTQKTFDAYCDSLSNLKTLGNSASERAKKMRENREAYLAQWKAEIENVKDPAVKQSVQERAGKVHSDYDMVTMMGSEVRSAYETFIQDNDDIQSALRLDLTSSGVQAMSQPITKAKADGDTLSQKIEALSNELNTLQGKMSPQAPPQPQAQAAQGS